MTHQPSDSASHVFGHNAAAINYGHIGDIHIAPRHVRRLTEVISDRDLTFRDLALNNARPEDWYIERARLSSGVQEQIARGGHTVVIEGDSGTGKTAFLAAVTQQYDAVASFGAAIGPRTSQNVLLDLAAQILLRAQRSNVDLSNLLQDRDAEDLVANGLLPPGLDDPARFAALVARAGDSGLSPLVIVIDALDELAATGTELELPRYLPRGTTLVVSWRTGHRPHAAPLAVILPVRAADDDNLADLSTWLRAVEVAGHVKVDARRLARICGGVWIYARYVLEEIRSGLRHPSDLDGLPGTLTEYFAQSWWAADASAEARRLASVFAVAQAPLLPAQLAAYAAVDRNTARAFLRSKRPFLAVRELAGARAFAVYHRALADFLSGAIPTIATDSMLDMADELRDGARSASRAVAARYLADWGRDLGRLVERPERLDLDDGYGARFVMTHLAHSGQLAVADHLIGIDWLLAATTTTRAARRIPAWLAALDRIGRLGEAYTSLAALASSKVGSPTDLRIALLIGYVNGVAATLPGRLRVALVIARLWTFEVAWSDATRVPDRQMRCRALTLLLPHAPTKSRLRLEQAVLADAMPLPDAEERAWALYALAGQMVDPESVTRAAWDAAMGVRAGNKRAKVLTALLRLFPADARDEQVATALAATRNANDPTARAIALAVTSDYVSGTIRRELIAEALASADQAAIGRRSQSYEYLFGRLEAHAARDLLHRALKEVDSIEVASQTASAWLAIVRQLGTDRERMRGLHAAEHAARSVTNAPQRLKLLVLISQVNQRERPKLIQDVLDELAGSDASIDDLHWVLDMISPLLADRPADLQRGLSIARDIGAGRLDNKGMETLDADDDLEVPDDGVETRLAAGVAPLGPAVGVAELDSRLAAARLLVNDAEKADELRAILRIAGGDPGWVRAVVAVANEIRYPAGKAFVLLDAIRGVGLTDALLAQIIETARAVRNDRTRAAILKRLAPLVTEDDWIDAVARAATSLPRAAQRASVLRPLIHATTSVAIRSRLARTLLDDAGQFERPVDAARVLVAAAVASEGDLGNHVMARAWVKFAEEPDERLRARAMAQAARRAPSPLKEQLIETAVQLTRGFEDALTMAATTTAIAKAADAPLREELIRAALSYLDGVPPGEARSKLLRAMIDLKDGVGRPVVLRVLMETALRETLPVAANYFMRWGQLDERTEMGRATAWFT